MKVTIIIPVYNAEKYIARCLESVIVQSYSDWEVIVVNDGSRDSSANIIADFCRKDDRIRAFHYENSGVSAARNHGLDKAMGDVIVFLDSDDALEPNCLAEVINVLEQTNGDIVRFPFRRVENGKKDDFKHTGDIQIFGRTDAIANILSYGSLNTVVCGGAYDRRILNQLRFDTDLYLGEDTCFHIAAVANSDRVVYIDQPYYLNYIEPNSLSRKILTKTDIENVVRVQETLQGMLDDIAELRVKRANYSFEQLLAWCNRIILEKPTELGNEYIYLMQQLEDILKKYKIVSKKRYAYYIMRTLPGLYRLLIRVYYNR